MEKIIFNEKDHSYYYKGIRYISATQIVGRYFEYDSDYWLTHGAFKELIPDFGGIKKEMFPGQIKPPAELLFPEMMSKVEPEKFFATRLKIRAKWDKERDKRASLGTEFHLKMEEESYKRGVEPNRFTGDDATVIRFDKEHDNEAYSDDLWELPDGYYPELLVFNHRFQCAGQVDRCWVTTIDGKRYVDIDDYKGLPLDTEIPTPEGFKLMKDIAKGDVVYDGKGNKTKVKNVSAIHYNQCYKLTLDTKEQIVCDHEHRWEISVQKKRKEGDSTVYYYTRSTVTTEELFSMSERGEPLRIECSSLEEEEKKLPIDPYVLGLWLADGNRTCGTLTCVNSKIWEEVGKRGYTVSENHNINQDRAESRTIYGISKHLRALNLISNKHIPMVYMRSSYKQRLDLLRGLMDGDGYYHKSRRRCVMITTREWQRNAVHELACSLGFKPTTFSSYTKGFGKENVKTWHVCFSPSVSPFLCRNHEYKDHFSSTNRGKKNRFRYIRSVEKTAIVPTKCIEVESDNSTYLFSRSYIKTHNTNAKKPSAYGFNPLPAPLSHLKDSKVTRYNLQINMYAWMMEEFGFIPRHLGFTHIKDLDPDKQTLFEVDYNRRDVELMMSDLMSIV